MQIKLKKVTAEDSATREFIAEYRAIVECWENGEVEHATPCRNLEEVFYALESYVGKGTTELVGESDCDCYKLPTKDMDGSDFGGVCKKCEARMTEAGYDRYAMGGV